jgi:hypothetical protein
MTYEAKEKECLKLLTAMGVHLLKQGSTIVAFGLADCACARVVEFAAAQFELASPCLWRPFRLRGGFGGRERDYHCLFKQLMVENYS